MRSITGIALAVALASVVNNAHGQVDTFTQVGSVQCQEGGTPPNWHCPNVTFPVPFGDVPQVIVSVSTQGFASGPATAVASNITAQGMSLAISSGFVGMIGKTPVLSWVAVGPKQFRGAAVAKYIVLTVVYAPPGTNGGHGSSSVSYASGSTTGTTTSASQSFQSSNSLSLTTSAGFLGSGGGTGLSFQWTDSTMDSQSLDIKKSLTSTLNWSGPSQDGISHDEDVIYLLLSPPINLTLSTSGAASWLLGNTQSCPIQYVHVGWLNGHQPMPPGVLANLQSAGITASDYPDILARDPLANGGSIDSARFVSINTTFPYEPPYSASDPVPTITTNITDSSTQIYGTEVSDTYKVGLSISAGGGFLGLAKVELKDTQSWQWTNKSSLSTSTGTTQAASATIGGPAYGYAGPTLIAVYEDTIYHTFAFALIPPSQLQIAVAGTVVNVSGKPVPNSEVLLTDNGVLHRTFTNGKGEFSFAGNISGPVSVQSGAIVQILPQSPPRTMQIKLP